MRFKVNCPHCGIELTDQEHGVSGDKGFKVKVKTGGQEGTIWISRRLGDLKIDSGDIKIEDRAVVEFFCPECNKKLSGNGREEGHAENCKCKECKAPMVHLEVKMTAKICSRRGCEGVKIGGTRPNMNMDQVAGGTYFW